jgi:H+-transporting ATPase
MSAQEEDEVDAAETSPLVTRAAKDVEVELGGAEGEEGLDSDTGIPEPQYKVGLTSAQADVQLKFHGYNAIEIYVEPWYLLLLHQFTMPMSFMLEVAMVISGAAEEWPDFAIIGTMLIVNCMLGFVEEMKARASVDALKKKAVSPVSVVRDGSVFNINPKLLVPQDVIYIRAGDAVPADCVYIAGPEMKVNTAAVTGESLPRRYGKEVNYCDDGCEPKEGQEKYDRYLQQGCTIQEGAGSYCYVKRTGTSTTQGAAMGSMDTGHSQSAFEKKIIDITMYIIIVTLIDVAVVIIVQCEVRGYSLWDEVVDCLSLIIASVPVALPMVIQITMSLGSLHMSEEHGAVVTSLPALQDIASMEVLCSDKTGTLTTAEFTAYPDRIWVNPNLKNLTQEEILTYAAVACGPSGEDVIDKAVFVAVTETFGKLSDEEIESIKADFTADFMQKNGREPQEQELLDEFHAHRVAKAKEASAGRYEVMEEEDVSAFTPELKRFVCKATYTMDGSQVICAKGLVSKMLSNGGEAGANELNSFTVNGHEQLQPLIEAADLDFSREHFKTIAVSFAKKGRGGKWEWEFGGIIPMKDPPRHDTPEVIRELKENLHVDVKMVTGDHLNIAEATALDIGMKMSMEEIRIYPSSELQKMYTTVTDPSTGQQKFTFTEDGEAKVHAADGFAQVLPKDKAAVIAAFKSPLHGHDPCIVGMTGDGVNDAVALKNSHVGIAVHDATPAAKNAADMILTREGLSPILAAVRESRCIYARLRSYVLYRISATIQIVTVLSTLVFAYDIVIPAFYVILLALLNDITMLTVSYDNATPSRFPEKPTVAAILVQSFVVGLVMALSSIGFYVLGYYTAGVIFSHQFAWGEGYVDGCIYLQISLGIEMMIFNCRNPYSWFWEGNPPNWRLVVAVMFANGLVTVLCLFGWVVDTIEWKDVLFTIGYDIAIFFLVDAFKVLAGRMVQTERFEQSMIPWCGAPSTTIDDAGVGVNARPRTRGFQTGPSPDVWSLFGAEVNTWMQKRISTGCRIAGSTGNARRTTLPRHDPPPGGLSGLRPSFLRNSA